MHVVRHTDARRTSTPNGVMTTYASPTQGGSDQALWRVEMAPGAVGPEHAMDAEQVWTIVDGAATLDAGEVTDELSTGDTVVLPAGELRRFRASGSGFTAIVTGRGGAVASGPDREPVVPGWIA